jgi:hypothetical protein
MTDRHSHNRHTDITGTECVCEREREREQKTDLEACQSLSQPAELQDFVPMSFDVIYFI